MNTARTKQCIKRANPIICMQIDAPILFARRIDNEQRPILQPANMAQSKDTLRKTPLG